MFSKLLFNFSFLKNNDPSVTKPPCMEPILPPKTIPRYPVRAEVSADTSALQACSVV